MQKDFLDNTGLGIRSIEYRYLAEVLNTQMIDHTDDKFCFILFILCFIEVKLITIRILSPQLQHRMHSVS